MSNSSGSRKARIATSVANVMHTNAVYFPSYRVPQGDTPGAMNYGCISHVYYAYANVDARGLIFLNNVWWDVTAPVDGGEGGGLGSLMELKKTHPHLRVILSVGGPSSAETFPVVASNEHLRENFASSAREFIDATGDGLDGIDLVWQYPYDEHQGRNFLALLSTVRKYLPEDQYLLTAALPPTKAVLKQIDLPSAAQYLDLLNLTTYDFVGPQSAKAGHHAQLYAMHKDEGSASTAVQYLMSHGFPARKILMGIPCYGWSFIGASGPGSKNRGVSGQEVVFDYKDLPCRGAKESVDKRAVAAQCVGGDGGFVTYDTPETVKMKAMFCRQKGLGGLFYWEGPMDAKDSSRSLITAGFRALHSS